MTNQDRSDSYRDRGCENRAQYLAQLAEEYDIDLPTVKLLADVLGPDEDFDGLIVSLDDAGADRDYEAI